MRRAVWIDHLIRPTLALAAVVCLCVSSVIGMAAGARATAVARESPCRLLTGTYNDFPGGAGPRTYRLFVPEGATSKSPMIISLHGAKGSAEGQEARSGFAEIALRQNAIAVYPQALGETQNTMWVATPGGYDVRFVARLTAYLHKNGCSSPDRTYLNGFSMGAMMTARLICEYPHRYAGAGMVSGALLPTPGCRIPRDMPITVVHGVNDDLIRFDGTIPERFEPFIGPRYSTNRDRVSIAAAWAKAKRCPRNPRRSYHLDTQTVVVFRCPKGADTTVLVHSGGHEWNPPAMPLRTSTFIWSTMR